MGEEPADRVGEGPAAEERVEVSKREIWGTIQREDPQLADLAVALRGAFGASADWIHAGGQRYGLAPHEDPDLPRRWALPPRLLPHDGKPRPRQVPDVRAFHERWVRSDEVIAFQSRGDAREAARIRRSLRVG